MNKLNKKINKESFTRRIIVLSIILWFILSLAILLILYELRISSKIDFFWMIIVIFVVLGLSHEIVKKSIECSFIKNEKKRKD